MSKFLAFDIETGSRPWDEIASQYQPPEPLPPWSDDMVKYGQTKDPGKRKAKYDEVKADYEAKLARQSQEVELDRLEWASKAALSPLTGCVLAIGLRNADQSAIIGIGGELEEEILAAFWSLYKKYNAETGSRLIGFNIKHFDVPFLVQRSWYHGVPVPESIIEKGRYLSPTFLDLMVEWAVGEREMIGLNTLAKFFGIGSKPAEVNGGMFAQLWRSGNAESRQQAIAYLENDLDMTWKLAERMGMV